MAQQYQPQHNPSVDLVTQNLQSDSMFKTLTELLRASPQQPSLSGLQDIDYPNMLNLMHKIPIISNITTVPFPAEVMERCNSMQHDSALGIFPEISRAWVSVDSCVYFWAYDDASDVAYYYGLDQTIVGVNLFKPKPNVYKSHIKYLLCLVTASDITMLEVTCSDETPGSAPSVFLISDPLFTLSTDNVLMSVMAATDDGRLFLGGNDGCLYEVVYQAEEGWFSKKCRKVNHSHSMFSYITPSFLNFNEQEPIAQIEIDCSRNLLYTRTIKSTIQIYDLGSDGASIRHVASRSLSSIVNQASCIARTIDTINFKPIVGIKVLTKSESGSLNLVVVTQSGVRMYFSACGGDRPTSLDLVHVRLPPGFTPSSLMQRPNSVSNVYHKHNTFIMSSTQSENKDYLWFMTNDFYVYEDQMMEALSIDSLGGKVWCMVEEVRPKVNISNPEFKNAPLVVKQHYEERRKFILLTSQGVHIFYKQRPIDQLNLLLTENQGSDSPTVRHFFESTKLAEACSTSLILASSCHLPQEAQLVEWATLAYFKYGGEPRLIRSMGQNGAFISTPIKSHMSPLNLPNVNVSPVSHVYNRSMTMGHPDQDEVQFSARHDAIYLYFSRILRPFWNTKVSKVEFVESNRKVMSATLTLEEISLYLKRLVELKKFMDKNLPKNLDHQQNQQKQQHQNMLQQQHLNRLNKSNLGDVGRDDNVIDAMSRERESLSLLSDIIVRCIEVLNLYKLAYEHQFSAICSSLSNDFLGFLQDCTFESLILHNQNLTAHIASALVRRYLDDNITTDAICRRLHELCPSIFSQENALQAKAHEMILQSRCIVDKTDKERMINEAVLLLKKIGVRLDLQSVCDLLHSARAHKHIVDVCLFVADKRDPMNIASNSSRHLNLQSHPNSLQQNQSIFQIGSAANENEEAIRSNAVALRTDCYMKIIETLDILFNKEDFNEVFECCIKSTDNLFHVKLYEWLCEKNLSTKLLEIQSPYVENFLMNKANSDNYSTKYLDLMWRFYERRSDFVKAAKILDQLAQKPTTDYGLEERLEYLSRAKICIEALATPGEILHDLEEKMDVAKIQIQVYKRVRETLPQEKMQVQEALNQLNYALLTLKELYENYALEFKLYDCQLAIVKCADHCDPGLIEKLWKAIVDEVLAENKDKSTDTQLHIIANKIENLGKMLMPSERFFPVYYIIAYLEFKTHSYQSLGWVPSCLMRIGFKPITLLDPYHKFYKSREHSIFWPGKPIHVLRVIANLIGSTLDQCDNVFASACLDKICEYLIDLELIRSSDKDCEAAKKLREQFTMLQSKINQRIDRLRGRAAGSILNNHQHQQQNGSSR